MADLKTVQANATVLRKRTRDIAAIELCDMIAHLSLAHVPAVAAKSVRAGDGCPVCAARRAKKAQAQKQWRAKSQQEKK